jgi:hypothetical protein
MSPSPLVNATSIAREIDPEKKKESKREMEISVKTEDDRSIKTRSGGHEWLWYIFR